MPGPEDHLLGRWVHSREDDHDGINVYRRPDYDFPPARGRRGVEFRADGSFLEWAIGRGDTAEARPGQWGQTPDGATVARPQASGQALRVVRVEPDRLEVVQEAAP
ncbi:MAG: hypothetical protein QOE58_1903 [Actinomycetota bacterium]|jgi:hypothetical protein|nr:hypothetical protein [Actinomycetota bacterium]